jgi:hypothetical protein
MARAPIARIGSRVVTSSLLNYVGSVRRELVLEFASILIQTTPVLTGHARNNWIPSMGRAVSFVDGSREFPSNAAQVAGIADVQAEPTDSTRVASLANNVEYVKFLNRGSSKKANPGFVEQAIVQGMANVRSRLGRLIRSARGRS